MKITCLIPSLFLGIALSAAALPAQAQTVPAPAEFYFDEDRSTTQPIIAVRGEGDAVVDRLAKMIERDPRATEPTLQLAGIAMKGGREELGRSLYTRAIGGLDRNSRLMRPARWNYGWDLYRAGDASGALAQWAVLAEPGPIRGEWLPTTLAMALWKLDRKDEAVKWYAAAVRTYPDRWSSPADIAALLPDWREEDRATLIEVQRAWAANPPTWP